MLLKDQSLFYLRIKWIIWTKRKIINSWSKWCLQLPLRFKSLNIYAPTVVLLAAEAKLFYFNANIDLKFQR
jgi:hypothetical protein